MSSMSGKIWPSTWGPDSTFAGPPALCTFWADRDGRAGGGTSGHLCCQILPSTSSRMAQHRGPHICTRKIAGAGAKRSIGQSPGLPGERRWMSLSPEVRLAAAWWLLNISVAIWLMLCQQCLGSSELDCPQTVGNDKRSNKIFVFHFQYYLEDFIGFRMNFKYIINQNPMCESGLFHSFQCWKQLHTYKEMHVCLEWMWKLTGAEAPCVYKSPTTVKSSGCTAKNSTQGSGVRNKLKLFYQKCNPGKT